MKGLSNITWQERARNLSFQILWETLSITWTNLAVKAGNLPWTFEEILPNYKDQQNIFNTLKIQFFSLNKPYLLIITWINALFYYRSICQADGYTAVIEANLGELCVKFFWRALFLQGHLVSQSRRRVLCWIHGRPANKVGSSWLWGVKLAFVVCNYISFLVAMASLNDNSAEKKYLSW